MSDCDVVVLGLGPGGEDAAGKLAESGLEVVAVDSGLVGGECPYWGCIPSKTMIRAANLLAEARRVNAMAGSASVTPDWSPLARHIREETDDWNDQVAVERLQGRGARLVRGHGRLQGRRAVEVAGELLRARRAVLIDTGTAPWVPPVPGLDELSYWTNRQAVETDVLPRSLVVLGGGAIGVELAQVFSRFGVELSVVEVAERLLSMEEPESSDLLARVLREEGVAVHCGAQITRLTSGPEIGIELEDGSKVRGEKLLVAAGRRPDLAAIGAGTIGVDEKGNSLPTDEHMRVTDGVWAIGDVTGHGAFTHMSLYQAAIAVDDILGRDRPGARYHAVPRVTFTDPEIGAVGMSEREARRRGLSVRTGYTSLAESSRGAIHRVGNAGFVKLVADDRRRVLVGATSAGPSGGEMLGLLTLAVHAEVPLEQLEAMIYAYPTFHRAIQAALDDLARGE